PLAVVVVLDAHPGGGGEGQLAHGAKRRRQQVPHVVAPGRVQEHLEVGEQHLGARRREQVGGGVRQLGGAGPGRGQGGGRGAVVVDAGGVGPLDRRPGQLVDGGEEV